MAIQQPKRTKYRKPHHVSFTGKAKGNVNVDFGEFGLMATEGNWISNRQLEAGRIAISKFLRKTGKMWMRVFPHIAKTKKPAEVRMGSGKGSPETWVAVVKSGTVIYEISGIDPVLAKKALTQAGHKLNVTTKIISRKEKSNAVD